MQTHADVLRHAALDPTSRHGNDPDRVDRGVALGVRAPGRRLALTSVPCG